MTRLGIAAVCLSGTLEDKLADFEPTGEVESDVGLTHINHVTLARPVDAFRRGHAVLPLGAGARAARRQRATAGG